MALPYEDLVRAGLPRQVADLIRSAILEGRLAVDERLPTEEDLARRFGVSRPTMREALKVLAAQNLIRSRRGPAGGTFIARPEPGLAAQGLTEAATLLIGTGAFEVGEILTARLESESLCARLAALHHRPEDLALLQAELEVQSRNGLTDQEFCASDVRFHRAVVAASRNAPLALMMHAVIESFIPVINMLVIDPAARTRQIQDHRAILTALQARDAAATADLMRAHLTELEDRLNRALAERTRPARSSVGAGAAAAVAQPTAPTVTPTPSPPPCAAPIIHSPPEE